MKKSLIAIAVVLLLLIVIPSVTLIGTYNNLVQLEENVNSKWAQVENQLKRRADLIPNLVNTVKGFANQEKEVLIGVTEARSKLQKATTPKEYAEANAQVTTALERLNFVVERYPELKSNENFIRLQDELAGTENRIAVARRDYNEAVKGFNSKIRKFPTNIIANMFGFENKEYFEVDQKDKEVPEVNFE
ncbi:LemA family protein [Thermohalobacter berrensis]|uniref:LemA family protein n=1 Tax=Thermohalobacter berrensis TaxID=99594 RepID=A0A419T5M0_9FIRM|nr:LemA family protein [Thermohalobacter berrensis]RKD32733.1 LemA family protein [Thermohalobacter berrensis]